MIKTQRPPVRARHFSSPAYLLPGLALSYELACARAQVFRAAAIYEGAQLSGCDGGSDPIALWQMVVPADAMTVVSAAGLEPAYADLKTAP